MKKTNVITCQCKDPDVEYLDRNYTDYWVCGKCHHFGGCNLNTRSSESNNSIEPTYSNLARYIPMSQCCNDNNDIQHLEDKIDNFRTAVHDKVLSYGSMTKGIGIGLLIAVIIMFLVMALGIFNFNPIVSPSGSSGGQYSPTVPSEPPTTPFPTLP